MSRPTTHVHACMDARMHAYAQVREIAQMSRQGQLRLYANDDVMVCMWLHACTHACVCIRTYMHMAARSHIHACIHTHIHTRKVGTWLLGHTHMHTYTHTYMQGGHVAARSHTYAYIHTYIHARWARGC